MALRGNIRPAASISGGIKKASGGGGAASFEVDETLSFVGGVLSVNATDQVEEGNKLPVTSGGVYAAVEETVDRALEQAKESGDFDGDPGKSAYEYALDGGFTGSEEDFAAKLAKEHPKKISELENDSKFITASGAPVQSVNGKTGSVTLNADDVGARAADWMPTAAQVGARPDNWMPTAAEVGALPDTYTPPNQTAEQVGADPSGTAAGKVAAHNTNTGAHSDIRLLISALATRLDALANSDDTTLDQMAEIVEYIKDNRDLIDQVTTGKVSVTDIINNLSTNVANKPLSAAQGVALKALIDAIVVPVKVSELTNDTGFITKAVSDLVNYYKKSEVYTQSKVNELLKGYQPTGDYALKGEIPTALSALSDDATHRLVTDTQIAAWNAKSNFSGSYNDLSNKPSIPSNPSDIGAVSESSALIVTGIDADGNTHTWTMYGVKQ